MIAPPEPAIRRQTQWQCEDGLSESSERSNCRVQFALSSLVSVWGQSQELPGASEKKISSHLWSWR